MNQNFLLALTLLTLTPFASTQDGTKHDLKINATKGTKAQFTIHSKTTQDLDMGGQQMAMGHDIQRILTIEVADVDKDGNLSLKVTWNSAAGKMLMPMGGEVEFDTAKAPEGDAGDDSGMGMPGPADVTRFLSAMIGKTLDATITAKGQDLEVKGLKELTEGAAKKLQGMGASMMLGLVNEGLLKRDVESAFCRLPKDPTAVGGNWKTEIKEAGRKGRPGMRTEGTLKLDKVDKEQIVISMDGALVKDEPKDEGNAKEGGKAKDEESDDPQVQMQREMMKGMKVSNGKVSASTTLSRADGMALKAEFKMAADITMPSPMGGEGEMKIAQKATITCERGAPKKAEAAPKTEKK